MKKGARYLRYSSDGQSNSSIERQDTITASWMKYNETEIIDTFIDEGYTAKNFDRPDVKVLFDFLKKNKTEIDFLVVAELTRFSREAGDAISMVKQIQKTYGIKIVSASRNSIYDCNDPTSFLMMGLEFLLGNVENIKRENDIKGGIYTAKAIEGRYIGSRAPFGYKKEGEHKDRHLVIEPKQAEIISYIFTAFLRNTPQYIIFKRIREMGFAVRGNSMIEKILTNPVYAGLQSVKSYKDLPGGFFPAKHEPIIDLDTWKRVQEKLKAPPKRKIVVSDDIPLRGVLKCHCKQLLTAAPSRNKIGNYYYYYKCQTSGHNNVSAKKAHEQLQEILKYMSLPETMVIAIRDASERLMTERMKENRKQLQCANREYSEIESKLISVEEKFLDNQINHETYDRWFSDLTQKRIYVKNEIEKLSKDQTQTWMLLQQNLDRLTDMTAIYQSCDTLEKQELIRKVFDNRLYYQSNVYRTPYVMPVFSHNLVILNQKQLLIVDGMNTKMGENPLRWS